MHVVRRYEHHSELFADIDLFQRACARACLCVRALVPVRACAWACACSPVALVCRRPCNAVQDVDIRGHAMV